MVMPPAVIIHGIDDLRLVLATKQACTIFSARHAASYGGCLWWQSLLGHAPAGQIHVLDCGDEAGRALEALQLGLPGLVLDEANPAFALVAELAARQGADLYSTRPRALDLAATNAAWHLNAWLAGDIGKASR